MFERIYQHFIWNNDVYLVKFTIINWISLVLWFYVLIIIFFPLQRNTQNNAGYEVLDFDIGVSIYTPHL